MENEEKQADELIGEMRKRRETMPDGKRYIVYFTFGNDEGTPRRDEVNENV